MTEINAKLISELQESARRSSEQGTGFVLPWRMYTDNGQPLQQDDHTCSCGCGCKKGKALAARMAKDAQALMKVLQGVEAHVASLKTEAKKKPTAAKAKRKSKKTRKK
jgi:hypothetical protein